MDNISCNWNKGMQFDAIVNGHNLIIDADELVGGTDKGPRPKPLLLLALAGCSGMDVISLLHKMRIFPESFKIDVQGELTSEHPKYYSKILIVYTLKGLSIDNEKVEKAVKMSQDKYCGVFAMLNKSADIDYQINIME